MQPHRFARKRISVPSSICLMKYFTYRDSEDMCISIDGPKFYTFQSSLPTHKKFNLLYWWSKSSAKDMRVCFCARCECQLLTFYDYSLIVS